jgi:RimJ/RimL family protein N-acetyltransferase
VIIDLPRLRLRPFKPEDGEAVVAALNDWQVAQWLIAPPHPYGQADFERYAEIVRQDHAGGIPTQFAIAQTAGDTVIGCMAVVAKPDGVGELGYWFARAYWGQGLASEAATAVIQAAERNPAIRRLAATTDPENAASRRLLVKAGFSLVRQIRRQQPTRRGSTEVCLYERARA